MTDLPASEYYRNVLNPIDDDDYVRKHCDEFYICVAGTAFKYECPSLTYFNVASQVCEIQKNVDLENCKAFFSKRSAVSAINEIHNIASGLTFSQRTKLI